MQHGDGERRNPFGGLAEELETAPGSEVVPAVLARSPAKGRKTPVRPSERRRRARQLSATFSEENGDVPERLRTLAERWGILGPDGVRPSASAVLEYLLMPRLEAAEKGEVTPPGWAK